MKNPLSTLVVLFCLFGSFTLRGQDVYLDSSCNSGGEIRVCGKFEVLKIHSDFDKNCSEWNYTPSTVLKTVVDYCSPNMSESTIFEEGGPDCPLNNF